jgi:hypothetical protein
VTDAPRAGIRAWSGPLVEACAAALPAVWLLGRGLLDPASVPGHPRGHVYATLAVAEGTSRGVDPGVLKGADPAMNALAPLVARWRAPAVLEGLVVLGVLGGAAALHGLARRVAPAPEDAWIRVVTVAVALAGPAIVLAWGDGRPSAAQPWALALPALVMVAGPDGPGWRRRLLAGGAGALVGALGSAMIPGAALVVLAGGLGRRPGDGPIRVGDGLVCLGSAVMVGLLAGWRPREAVWDLARAWAVPPRTPDPEMAGAGFVGLVVAGLLAVALLRRDGRPWAVAGVVGLLLPALRWVGPSVLHALPLLAMLGAAASLRGAWPGGVGSAVVLLGTLQLAEGWKGAGGPLPLPTASLGIPVAAREVPAGRVLDLPLHTGAPLRAAWWRVHHGRAGAAGPDDVVPRDVEGVAQGLLTGGGTACRSPVALGFTSVLARREGELPEIDALVACLGPPTVDDGGVARWDLGPPPGP